MYCWPCFIPWWYKTHYAPHYLSVRLPGNEMIHIQEGYLRLHFNISKQQHVIFTLKPCSETKAFDSCSNVCSVNGKSTVSLTLAFEDDPLTLIQMHPRLLWFSAGVELSIKIRRRKGPGVWLKHPFNKADCPRHSKGKRRFFGNMLPFLQLCQNDSAVKWNVKVL